MATLPKTRTIFTVPLLVATAFSLAACTSGNGCDMTPDGSVWVTVVRLSDAEKKFHKSQGRYGALAEMTDLEPGLPARVTAGRMGSYKISIELIGAGYVLRADPVMPHPRRRLSSFYADQTGIVTYDRSGAPATPAGTRM